MGCNSNEPRLTLTDCRYRTCSPGQEGEIRDEEEQAGLDREDQDQDGQPSREYLAEERSVEETLQDARATRLSHLGAKGR